MREDLRKQITLYPPADAPDQTPQKHTLLNARDLIAHSGWSTTKRVDELNTVNDVLKASAAENTPAEQARLNLLGKPVGQMTRDELQAYAEEKFGTKLDKRLNQQKMIDRLTELATASGITLNLGVDPDADLEDEPDEGVQGAKETERQLREAGETQEGVQGAKEAEGSETE